MKHTLEKAIRNSQEHILAHYLHEMLNLLNISLSELNSEESIYLITDYEMVKEQIEMGDLDYKPVNELTEDTYGFHLNYTRKELTFLDVEDYFYSVMHYVKRVM